MKALLTRTLELVEASPRIILCVVGFVIFCVHLGWGIWFVTASPTNMPRTPLRAEGDAYLKSFPSWDTYYESDGAFHNRAAVGVIQTGIPRTRSGSFCDHSPIYAYFLAACYKIGGLRLLSIAIPQAALMGALGVMLGLTASRLSVTGLEWTTAALTPFLLLADLDFASYVAYPGPPALLMLVFAVALFAASRPTARNLVLFAFAMAVGIFTHAAFFVVGAAAGLWLLIQVAQRKERVYLVCALMLFAVGVLKLGVALIDTSSNGKDHTRKGAQGMVWAGNNPYYEDMEWWSLWGAQRFSSPSRVLEQRFRDYLDRSGGSERDAGVLWMRENPLQYAKLCFIRLRAELGPFTSNATFPRRVLCLFHWILVFPAGGYGLWRARRTAFGLLAILIVVILVIFDSLVFMSTRYRLPAEMVLTVFAGLTYARCLQAWTGFKPGEPRRPDEVLPARCF